MSRSAIIRRPSALATALWAVIGSLAAAGPTLEEAWNHPPQEAKLGAYWWWLNGNVTKEALTSDLEAMRDAGFGSAVIFDADGASQDDNDPVPPGPTFASPEWRELYRHALREAHRLGITLSLNIQSGWNLGGPTVEPKDAAKLVVWSETAVIGPQAFDARLPVPEHRIFYQDSKVVAWREKPSAAPPVVTASSSQTGREPALAADGDERTLWVSDGSKAADAPTPERPQWLQLEFPQAVGFDELIMTPRPDYGPRAGEIQVSEDGKTFRKVSGFKAARNKPSRLAVPKTTARFIRLLVTAVHPSTSPGWERTNVQIAELTARGDGRDLPPRAAPINQLAHKTLRAKIRGSAPDMSYLLDSGPSTPGEEATRGGEVLDLTDKLSADGTLRWQVPEGNWRILRFGSTIGPRARVSTSSADWKGHALDVFDERAFRSYWDQVVVPLIQDAGPLAGTTLRYLHTDSWEIEPVNWTAALPEEFKARRGYDLLPWMPVLAGHIVDSREASHRFLDDFRRTLGDLAIERHYLPFRKWARESGLMIHPEAGGPHVVPIDAQQCLGVCDAPMSEFWAESWRHRMGDPSRFFVKQPASAAHTNGRRLVVAEGFTTVGPHWQERIWNNLKPSFDKACTEGLNLLVWHAWVCSPESAGTPGQQYFAGTHLNPKVTWWSRGKPFFDYINRCQAMLQRGLPVSDVLYYYGDHVPNYTQLRDADPAGVGTGHDYDVISTDVLLSRVSAKDGRLVLPEGTSYRLLMLPALEAIPPPVLEKVRELANAGAFIAGPKPVRASGLTGAPHADIEVRTAAGDLWNPERDKHVKSFDTAREALESIGLGKDFSFTGGDGLTAVSYIHRRDGEDEIYFVASRGERPESLQCRFRVSGKIPELWDPVSGRRLLAASHEDTGEHTTLPIDLASCGSVFVIFRKPDAASATEKTTTSPFETITELPGPYTVRFDPAWGGPESVELEKLICWTKHPDSRVKHYSGTATYLKTFGLTRIEAGEKYHLDLGHLAELAEVRLNGTSLGILWTPPFRVEITGLLKPEGNLLEIDIVNFWPNRIIGDASLPPNQRFTRTNIRKLTADTDLMESGLLGPVRILKRR